MPLGGAAGLELNRRMMRAWGIDTRSFTGYTILTNLWDVGSKLLLPVIAVLVLAQAGGAVTTPLRTVSLLAGLAFAGLVAAAAALLASQRSAVATATAAERVVGRLLRLARRPRELDLVTPLLEVRRECARAANDGWLQMSAGVSGYVALQFLLLGACLHLTGAGSTASAALAGFAVERLLTVVPLTPGGVGLADLGLVGVLLALGGDPAGVTAAAVLYRVFVFAVEIPVGGSALGLWLLGRRLDARRPAHVNRPAGGARRIAHVTDVFLPRLGGIETHVDDLVRHQRALGLDAEVLTPTRGGDGDPPWVRRLPAGRARRVVEEYDVLHVHVSMLSPYGIGLARAAMARGVPVLVTVHSMWTGAGGLLRLAGLAGLRRWPVSWSAVSAAAAESSAARCPGSRSPCCPTRSTSAAWRPSVARAGADGGSTGADHLTVVSVMRLVRRKRPVQLVRAFEQARRLVPEGNARLVLVGDGRLRGRVERYARRHGLAREVHVTGRIPRDRVLDELRSASVYVSPAPKESFGIAALEARCAGLPVVAHRRSGVGEFVRDRVDGMLVEGEAQLAVAIAELVRDAELRARITAHNRRVAPRQDWSDVLQRTDRLYRAAAERASGRAGSPAAAPAPGAIAAEA